MYTQIISIIAQPLPQYSSPKNMLFCFLGRREGVFRFYTYLYPELATPILDV
jgi:hypothetical protein